MRLVPCLDAQPMLLAIEGAWRWARPESFNLCANVRFGLELKSCKHSACIAKLPKAKYLNNRTSLCRAVMRDAESRRHTHSRTCRRDSWWGMSQTGSFRKDMKRVATDKPRQMAIVSSKKSALWTGHAASCCAGGRALHTVTASTPSSLCRGLHNVSVLGGLWWWWVAQHFFLRKRLRHQPS